MDISIVEVWRRLGGKELPRRGRRVPAFWRGGDRDNILIDSGKNRFYDFAANSGGGFLALIETVRNCSRKEAVQWLKDEGLLPPDELTPSQRHSYQQAKHTQADLQTEIKHWKLAYARWLNQQKNIALTRADWQLMAEVAPVCNRVENGSPQLLEREFTAHRLQDPKFVAQLIAEGRRMDQAINDFAEWAVKMETKKYGAL